jgi:hypothetical protein
MGLIDALDARAYATDDPEELRELLTELSDYTDELERRLVAVKVDPRLNQDLARSVQAFAEWQTSGYKGDSRTQSIVSAQLWSEVSENVRAVTGRPLEDVGPDAAQLVLLAPEAVAGSPPSSPVQQALFVLP